MEDLEKLRRIRKAKQKYIRNVQDDAERLLKCRDPTQEECLRYQLVTLQQILEDISKVDEGILNKMEDEGEIEHKVIETSEFKDFIYETIVHLELVLKNFEHQISQTKPDSKVVPSFSTK